MNVNYYLKNEKKEHTSVEAVVRYKGKRFKISTGQSVVTNFWDKTTHRARITRDYPDHEIINLKLEEFEIAIKKTFTESIRQSTEPTVEQLRAATGTGKPETKPTALFLDYFRQYAAAANIKPKTLKNYTDTERFLQAYETKTHHRLTFDEVNIQFYNNFRAYIMMLKKKDGEHYSMNYFGSIIKHIKTVMRESGPEGDKLHQNTDYKSRKFIKDTEDADTVYLSTAELDRINQLQIDEVTVKAATKNLSSIQLKHMTAQLAHIRNLLMIGSYTALRISDFSRIDWHNISAQYIRIKPVKGTRKNEDVVIPIHPVLKAIFAGNFNPAVKLGNHAINTGIRLLCQMAKINELITTVRTEGGRQVTRTTEKYKLVASHTCRRSGATNMLIAGVPPISIMKITNHKTERSFMKYIRISQEENARLLADHPFFKATTVTTPTEREAALH